MEEIKTKIIDLQRKAVTNTLTDADKKDIRDMSADAGLNVSFRGRCVNCYLDALVLLRLHYKVGADDGDRVLTPSGNFYFTKGTSKVIWWKAGSKTVLSAQSDDETIEAYIACFPCQKYFERVEQTDVKKKAESDRNDATDNVSANDSENAATGENEAENGTNEEGGEQ